MLVDQQEEEKSTGSLLVIQEHLCMEYYVCIKEVYRC